MSIPALLIAVLGAPAFVQFPPSTPAGISPAEQQDAIPLAVFQQEAVLHYRSLQRHDHDGDFAMSERQAGGFKAMADADFDGQATAYQFVHFQGFPAAHF